MNKKLFYVLVFLMSLSLVGIIFVQGYWIKNTVTANRQQFSFNANQILLETAEKLEVRELEVYYFAFKRIADSIGNRKSKSIDNFFKIQEGDLTDESLINSDELLEPANSPKSAASREKTSDSIQITRLVKKEVLDILNDSSEVTYERELDKRVRELMNMGAFEREYIRRAVQRVSSKLPIKTRVTNAYLSSVISTEFRERDLGNKFEYAIYKKGKATPIKSSAFQLQSSATYSVPLFSLPDVPGIYQLYVSFPQKNRVILSSITLMSALSILFTLIIIVAYTTALSQLIKQRQISEIKTDFINNMTHEFKTPIATMRLALDFLNNPKARNNEAMLSKYLNMIGEENKRMYDQVENILQISRLEKNDLDISKEPLYLHDLIDSAVKHVQLIVEENNGYIKKHFGALKSNVLVNESHFTNVLVNILENATKYSLEPPKIDVYTENVGSDILVKVRDQGQGMSKKNKKNIFKKFFRAHTGDVHDVKGHGLGLAYSKRIVEEHYGEISVESEKGKGSTFTIKLPLIK